MNAKRRESLSKGQSQSSDGDVIQPLQAKEDHKIKVNRNLKF
jgi:hypothetical protein